MPKGFFTQSAAVLLGRAVSIDAIVDHLKPFQPQRRAAETGGWMGNAAAVVPLRPEANGYIVVDVIDKPWPDDMGDPKEEPELFGAWGMGWFGPFVYPQSLARAVAMSFSWDEAEEAVSKHRAFVRIKSTYVLGAGKNSPVLPADYQALPELELVTQVALTLLQLPSALGYFNPNGEVLCSKSGLEESLEWHREHELPPLPIWANIRLFQLNPKWTLMDTVGMEQLDVDDHEACFPKGAYDPREVDSFLRNATEYVREHGPVIKDGDTMDGPGGVRWRGRTVAESITQRPRQVLRWLPADGPPPPPELD